MLSGLQVEVMLTLVTLFKITCASIRKAINLNISTNPLQQVTCTIHIRFVEALVKWMRKSCLGTPEMRQLTL